VKNILFVSYYFPPMGGAGVQRTAKFVRYLPEFGYRPIVVTVRPRDYRRHREFRLDKTLARDMDNGAFEMHHCPDPEPHGLRGVLERLGVFRLVWFVLYAVFWERELFWAIGAIGRSLQLARRRRLHAVYTTSGPYCTLLVGWVVKQVARVPWVADLRDLWTQDPLGSWPSRLHYWLTVAVERGLLRRADRVIANTPLAAKRMQALLGDAHADRVVTIPNGFDPQDLPPMPPPAAVPRPMRIVHVGTFHDVPVDNHTSQGLGARLRRWVRKIEYRPAPWDPWMRTPAVLLEGAKRLLELEPDCRQEIRLVFVGHLADGWRQQAEDLGLADVVEATGYLPHDQAMQRLMAADVLYCVQVGFQDPRRPVPYIPAKLYEYLATGKPILAPVAEGDTKHLLVNSGLGRIVDARDPDAIADALRSLLDQHRRGSIDVQPEWDFIKQFDRKNLTQQLAAVFDSAVGRERTA